MARAILADAVSLVRGDRYLTYDATPYNLTAWGFTEGARDIKNAAFGGTLSRLFQRGLPQFFPAESVYTHFPLVTPTGQLLSMDNVLRNLGKYEDYTYNRPTKVGDTVLVSNPDAIYNISSDPSNGLITTYGPQIKEVGLEPSFLSAVDDPVKFDKVIQLIQELFVPRDELHKTLLWFHDRTLELIREKNLPIINVRTKAHAIDVVKDVFRLVPVHWASTRVVSWRSLSPSPFWTS
jgi:linoleate 10R-lipoxygenase